MDNTQWCRYCGYGHLTDEMHKDRSHFAKKETKAPQLKTMQVK